MASVSKLRKEMIIYLVIVAGILVLLNLLGLRLFARWDLTENKVHSLSAGSIRLMKGLQDRLTVKAYFTENLPPPFNSHARYVRDILEEYQVHSGGKMTLEFIDPTGDEALEKQAQDFGIQKVGHRVIDKDQSEVKLGYRGIAFTYGAKTLAVPAVQDTVGLEYEITQVIKQLVGQKKTIGYLVGHGEPPIRPTQEQIQQAQMMQKQPPRGALSILREALPQYTFEEVDLQKGAKGVPGTIHLLLIAGTNQEISEEELFKIDQYLMKGGSLAVFVDGVIVEINEPPYQGMPPTFNAKLNPTTLRDVLITYGARLGSDLVLDGRSNLFPAQCPPIPMAIPRRYPAWPLATELPETNPVTFRLSALTFPWASSVELSDTAVASSGVEAAVLARTSPQSWRLKSEFEVDPCKIGAPAGFETGIGLAVSLKGSFKSAWADKPAPGAQAAVSEGDAGTGDDPSGKMSQSAKPGRVVVVGSSNMISDTLLSYLMRVERTDQVTNLAFVSNVMDWLTQDDDLIAIRAKTVEVPPLKTLTDRDRSMAKYGLIVFLPLAFIAFGVIRWRVRTARYAKVKLG